MPSRVGGILRRGMVLMLIGTEKSWKSSLCAEGLYVAYGRRSSKWWRMMIPFVLALVPVVAPPTGQLQ
jgi:hypothetical protein